MKAKSDKNLKNSPPMTYPHRIKKDSVTVTLYRVRSKAGVYFQLAWYESGARRRETHVELKAAIDRANELVENLATGRSKLNDFTTADREVYERACAILREINYDLLTAVTEFRKQYEPDFKPITVAEAVTAFKASRSTTSARHYQDVRNRLDVFSKAHGALRLDELKRPELKRWIENRSENNRTRNNWLVMLRSLLNWGKQERHLPELRAHALSDLKAWSEKPGETVVWMPEQLQRLFNTIYARKTDLQERIRLAAFVALQAWAGLRPAEALRLTWKDLKVAWVQNKAIVDTIVVGATKAKTRTRRTIRVEGNLRTILTVAKLEFSGDENDTVVGYAYASKIVRKLAPVWSHNVLRHSCATYLLILHPENEVALRLGTSPQMLHGQYKELAPSKYAAPWFEVRSLPVKN